MFVVISMVAIVKIEKLVAFYIRWTSSFLFNTIHFGQWFCLSLNFQFDFELFFFFLVLSSFYCRLSSSSLVSSPIFIAHFNFYYLLFFLLQFNSFGFPDNIYIHIVDESIEHIMHWIPPSIWPCMCLCEK